MEPQTAVDATSPRQSGRGAVATPRPFHSGNGRLGRRRHDGSRRPRSGCGRNSPSKAPPDPLRGEFLLHRIQRQSRRESGKVDAIDGLVLVEAGEHVADLASDRVVLAVAGSRSRSRKKKRGPEKGPVVTNKRTSVRVHMARNIRLRMRLRLRRRNRGHSVAR